MGWPRRRAVAAAMLLLPLLACSSGALPESRTGDAPTSLDSASTPTPQTGIRPPTERPETVTDDRWAQPIPNPAPLARPVEEEVPVRLHDQQATPPPSGPPGETATDDAGTRTPRSVDAPRETITGFAESSRELQPIPEGLQPYQYRHINPVPYGRVDPTGVRVFRADWDDTVYDHAVSQSQYALNALESYRLTGEEHYLEVAVANAQRIIDRKHVIDGAWYFPYDFDFDLYRNDNGVLTAPWSSGMASGQALSVFVRLHEVTGDQMWREAADHAFHAFLQAPDGVGYFSSFVDDDGLLWLEEYSRYPVMDSERVLNGHMWSMFGVWDYWMMHDHDHPEAERLFRGALYTLEELGMTEFRNPGWASFYSIWHRNLGITYHQHHQQQFLMLYRMTHDPLWVSRASILRSDYPEWRTTSGQAVLTPETTVAYRLDDGATHINDRTMEVLETQPVVFPTQTVEDYDRRGKMPGGPVVIRLSSGELEGWWVEEKPGHAWSRDIVEEHLYVPSVELVMDVDQELTLTRFEEDGTTVETRSVRLDHGTRYVTDRSAVVGGQASYHLSEGEYAGWWLPEETPVTVHRTPAGRSNR